MSLIILLGIADISFAEETKADKATAKLKVLSEAMDPNDIIQIRELLKAGANPNVRDGNGNTILMTASHKGCIDTVIHYPANWKM